MFYRVISSETCVEQWQRLDSFGSFLGPFCTRVIRTACCSIVWDFSRVGEGVVVGVVMADVDDAIELLGVEVSDDMRAMLERHPLPSGVNDADMNQDELAAALGTSVNSIGKWIKEPGFPIAEAGGAGKAYVLRLSHCYAWKLGRDAQEKAHSAHNKESIQKLQAQMLGLDMSDPQAQMTTKERRELSEADFAYSRAAQMRRQLLKLDDVTDLLETIFKIVRDGIEGMPDRLERELNLKPEEVGSVDRVGRDILNTISDKIEAAELTERQVEDVEVSNRLVI